MEFRLFFNCCANVFIIFLIELVWVQILSLRPAWHPLCSFIHPSDNGGDQYYMCIVIIIFLNCDIFIYWLYVCFFYRFGFFVHIWTCVWKKELLLLLCVVIDITLYSLLYLRNDQFGFLSLRYASAVNWYATIP